MEINHEFFMHVIDKKIVEYGKKLSDFISDHNFSYDKLIFYKLRHYFHECTNDIISIDDIGNICWFDGVIIQTDILDFLNDIVCDVNRATAFTINIIFL